MNAPAKLQAWLSLSVRQILESAVTAESLTLPLQLPGTRFGEADDDTEQWMAYYVLEFQSISQRSTQTLVRTMLQVSFFSRFSEDRADKDTSAPWSLAGAICNRIGKKHHQVKDYDSGSPTEQAMLFLPEPKLTYQDESRQFQPPNGSSKPINIHAVVATFDGILRRGS